MTKSQLAFTEGPSKEEVLSKWDRENPGKKRVAWKTTKTMDMFYIIIEYIAKWICIEKRNK